MPSRVPTIAVVAAALLIAGGGVAVLFGVSVESGSTDPGSVRETVAETNRSIDGYRATVEMTFEGVQRERRLVYRLSVDRPDRTRIRVLEPANQSGDVVVLNRTGTFTYDNGSDTWVQTPSGGNASDLLARLVEAVTNNESRFQGRERLRGSRGIVFEYDAGGENVSLRIGGTAPGSRFSPPEGSERINTSVWIDPERNLPLRLDRRYRTGNGTTRLTVRIRNLTLNPGFDGDTFSPDVSAAENYVNQSPQTEIFYSKDALRRNATMSLPDPDFSANYTFAAGAVSRNGTNRSLAITYRSNATAIIVTKLNLAVPLPDQGDVVDLDGVSVRYTTSGTAGIAFWNCSAADRTYQIQGTASRQTLLSVAESIGCPDPESRVRPVRFAPESVVADPA